MIIAQEKKKEKLQDKTMTVRKGNEWQSGLGSTHNIYSHDKVNVNEAARKQLTIHESRESFYEIIKS